MKTLSIGMAGFGGIAKVHALAYGSIPMYYNGQPGPIRLASVFTRREEQGVEACRLASFERYTTDYEDLLQDETIDIIDIALPNHLHFEFAEKALLAGKHVYCEKPLAMNVDEAERLVKLAQDKSLTTGVAFSYRFIPAVLRAKQLIEEGRIGDIYHFRFVYHHTGYEDPQRPLTWRLRKETSGGGALVDLGSHLIDLAHHLVGDLGSVQCVTQRFIDHRPLPGKPETWGPVDVDDFASLQVVTGKGSIGSIEASRFATGASNDLSFEIFGSRGALRFNLMDPNFLHFFDHAMPDQPLGGIQGFTAIPTIQKYPAPGGFPGGKNEIGWVRYHIASQFEFLRAVAEGRPHSPSFEEGLHVQRVIDAAYQSAESGRMAEVLVMH